MLSDCSSKQERRSTSASCGSSSSCSMGRPSYGRAAIVGVDGEMEHGGACVRPMLGRPMRAIIGGEAVISSKVKTAAGASVDVALGHKDDPWSFPHFDTNTLSVANAPGRTRYSSSSLSLMVDGSRIDAVFSLSDKSRFRPAKENRRPAMDLNADFSTRAAVHAARLDWTPSPIPGVRPENARPHRR